MDHVQLTTADYAHIQADEARKEAHELSIKIDGLADILGISSEDIIARGELVVARAKLVKEEQERKRKEEMAAEFQASGLSREEWDSQAIMRLNMRTAGRVSALDLEESTRLKGYNPFPKELDAMINNVTMGLLGLTK